MKPEENAENWSNVVYVAEQHIYLIVNREYPDI